MEFRGSEGQTGHPWARASGEPGDGRRLLSRSSRPISDQPIFSGRRHIIHLQRRRRQGRQIRHTTLGELSMFPWNQIADSSRKSKYNSSAARRIRNSRQSRAFYGIGGSASVSSIDVIKTSQAVLCPISLRVGMELALFAVHIEPKPRPTYSSRNDKRVETSSPQACTAAVPVNNKHETRVRRPPADEDSGTLRPCSTWVTEQQSVLPMKLRGSSAEKVKHHPLYSRDLESSAAWPRLLRAYDLGEPSASHSVGRLLLRVSLREPS